MDIRTINSNLIVRDNADNTKSIQGYALLFNQPSQPMPFIEYISPNALNGVDLSNVLLLYGHDFNNILARTDAGTLTLTVDGKGLFFNAQLANTTLANDVYNDIQAGNLKGCSFGFTIADNGDVWDTDANGNTIHRISQIATLDEVSVTPIPAYTETSVQVQRSLDKYLKGVKAMAENKETETKETVEEPKDETVEEKREDKATVESKDNTNKVVLDDEVRSSLTALKDEVRSLKAEFDKKAKEEAKHADDHHEGKKDDKFDKNKEDKGEKRDMKDITPNHIDKVAEEKRDFADFLKNGKLTRDVTGIGLANGQVLIPQTILPAENEPHQFPRLGSLVRTIAVKTTTGKLPLFMDNNGLLTEHTEFQPTTESQMPDIQPILWDLKTYTGKYTFSQDLITDSSYNWETELASQLVELRDNTDDSLIINALTNGVSAVSSSDLVSDLKTALNVNLKPIDSRNASVVMSQSAFNALDQMKDGMGRPLIQPDVTKSMANTILGKTVVVVDDTLFPSAKAGDINIIVAPLQKAVINFKSTEITGKFMDSYDVWYKILGIYLREDVEQARKDLITYIHGTKTAAATTTAATTASK